MKVVEQNRRSFLSGVAGVGISGALAANLSGVEEKTRGLLAGPDEGEHLIHLRDRGNIFIKLSAANGRGRFSLGTQQVMSGAGIPIHRHLEMEEAFYVLEGGGSVVLDDEPHPFAKGATIFIPRKAWHGFLNPDRELLLLWMVSPPGLVGFFRETCSPPGTPAKPLTREQIRAIALKYGTEFR